MGITTATVRYGEGFSGYLAHPSLARAPMPGVLVFQEAWGVDDHIEDVTRRFASAGYVALAPDLFAKDGARPPEKSRARLAELVTFLNFCGTAIFSDEAARQKALDVLTPDVRARISGTLGAILAGFGQMQQHVPHATAAAGYLRDEQPLCRGAKVGAVGYCMGGAVTGLLACADPALGAAAIYYGTAPAAELVSKIACPVYGFYGSKDTRIAGGLPAFSDAMKAAGKTLVTHVYEGAEHAFFNDNRPSYDAPASRDAFARTLEAFRTHLA